MRLLVLNTQRQYQEKQLSSFSCFVCGKVGMAFANKDSFGKKHYCQDHDPLINRKEIDE